MASGRQVPASVEGSEYQKTNKTSAIRSFIRQRTQSKGTASPARPIFDLAETPTQSPTKTRPFSYVPLSPTKDARPINFLPRDHPHAIPLGEIHQNQQKSGPPSSPTKLRDHGKQTVLKAKSAISLKALYRESDTNLVINSKLASPDKPKRPRSTANFANLLSRPKSSKNLKKQAEAEEAARLAKEKEEIALAEAAAKAIQSRPPIYAQFSSDYFARQPLGGKFLESPIDDYPPLPDSPIKDSFDVNDKEFLSSPSKDSSIKRKSQYLLAGEDGFYVSDISRQNSAASQKDTHETRQIGEGIVSALVKTLAADSERPLEARAAQWRMSRPASKSSNDSKSSILSNVNIKEVDAALEELLDRRNIPEDQRHKMRDVALSVKLDLIKHERKEAEEGKLRQPSRNVSIESMALTDASELPKSPDIKKRPRSRTFTLSRTNKNNTSPTKKAKPESSHNRGHHRTKSTDSAVIPAKSFATQTTASSAINFFTKGRSQTPEDFVTYLRKVSAPQKVEVGKMHKLRQLLRNEKIGWTDEFVFLGGMKEIVALLHRTIEIEWREEHEDSLLHEVLLCLKALCTTTLAQTYLLTVQSTLFPALVNMLFDPEHKGPAEFATRNIITYLLFTYLKCSPLSERHSRAITILSYIRDPQPPESERPVLFVVEMHTPRPYRKWNKEISDVTKEVFWIFLHSLNVVSLPGKEDMGELVTIPEYEYMSKHFPTEGPPVAAAPYVGSVEWDATNYLASNVDLLNAIIASLPTMDERNELRYELRLSGWEKCLGGTLRLCKEKFSLGLHKALRTWVAAAVEDGWEVSDVRCGPRAQSRSPVRKSPRKKVEEAPKIAMPVLDFEGAGKVLKSGETRREDVWL